KRMKRGAFIVLEGLDRSGKTTQAKKLAEWLKYRGERVELMRFPDRDEPFGKVIDAYLKKEIELTSKQALHLAFSADRWEKAKKIESLVDSGTYIVCDRYCYSGVAYSIASDLDEKWVKCADIGLPRPDIILRFDVEAQVAAQRGGFGDERLECSELQKRVSIEMKKLAERDERWKIVNANESMESVHAQVVSLVSSMELASQMDTISQL
ncbi:hypothetical protein PENTCL1PPCAC_6577, partial [Pristionchus entomophagus]